MYIPDDKIEEVRAASDIIDVVSDYVRLKQRGSNFFGLCPFHSEKTPSFSVNPGMGIYKCFGCGVGGDVFQFIAGVESLSFPEAVRVLADRANIALPEENDDGRGDNEAESVYHALRFAARHFFKQLTQSEAGKPALSYLRRRGFTAETIKQFGLGFAPEGWDLLLRAAEAAHVPPEILEKAGLIIPRRDGGGHYDRYRGRVIFPIVSHVGKVLGFGGRILADDPDQPKYINSPETLVYHKSRVLYGLYQGKQAIRKAEEVLLVEGYTDVIALHQAGVANVVATCGTALTADQIRMVERYAKRIILLYDADVAGAGAALRSIDLILEHGLAVYAVSLPQGADPDSYVRDEGGEAFRAYVTENREDFAAFKYALARRQGGLDTPEEQAETMRGIVASIALMPDPLMQETYLRRASEVLGVPDIRLHEVLEDLRRKEQRRARRAPAPPPMPPPDEEMLEPVGYEAYGAEALRAARAEPEPLPEEKILIRVMLEHGGPLVEFILGNMAIEEFTEGPSRDLVAALLRLYDEDRVSKTPFLEGVFGTGVQRLAAEVLVDQYEPSANWRQHNIPVPRLNAAPREAAASAMMLLKLDRVNEVIEEHRERLFHASQDGTDPRTLQERLMSLYELRKQIERRAFLKWNDL